jgi:hypothetical protein
MWRDMVDAYGETITLRRVGSPNVDKSVRARVTGFAPEELVGGITQGHRKVIVLAEDVESTGFPVPIARGGLDRVVVRGKTMMIEDVDDSTARLGGTLLAYLITASGA